MKLVLGSYSWRARGGNRFGEGPFGAPLALSVETADRAADQSAGDQPRDDGAGAATSDPTGRQR